ncbi:MAG: phosphate acyltransferase PlsX [Clostridiales bacterium]|jgi:glycerol-3-phosphate acyltransferase PlsX|nr:phosphate acyltransferase PlsX [Clostridiales bacterium]
MKIVVDAYGGDNAPAAIVAGAVDAMKADDGIIIVFTGKEIEIKELIKKENFSEADRYAIINADEIITNDEVPTAAVRSKLNSSLVVGLDYLKKEQSAAGFVSAGSTGAVLTGATLRVGRIENVARPALAPLLPRMDGKSVLLIDCGANVDCRPEMLLQFGIMGGAYMNALGVDKPRIALLNNGAESKKGNELTKAAFELLSASDLNFVGNTEAREIMSGNADVVVADGFVGNVALKACEGTALMILKMLKESVLNGGLTAKIGGMLIKKSLSGLKSKLDFNEQGGALFVGVNKVVVKAHGSSKRSAIKAAILQADGLAKAGLVEKISASLKN